MDRTKAFAGIALACALMGCSQKKLLTVGSKNFTEQVVLGEIIAQHLEQRLGIEVRRSLNLGGTLLTHQSLVSGEIDLYPEYTGTALTAILKLPANSDPAAVRERVRDEYPSRFSVEWLDPLGFNNTFVMVVRGDHSRKHNLQTLTDASNYDDGWRLGIGYEFQERPDGLAALNSAYKLRWRAPPQTMDMGLVYTALDQNQVTMVAGNATDGLLSKMDVKILRDDNSVFPPYEAAIAVRRETLDQNPGLRPVLEELSGSLTAEAMQRLNYLVDGQHKPVKEVAAEFLRSRVK